MPNVRFTSALRAEYQRLFDTCVIRAGRLAAVDDTIVAILRNRQRYDAVARDLGGKIPWFFIAVIHNMEASLNFTRHLHNGDPLSARTVHVPKDHPKDGAPPFTWEESAADALRWKKLDTWNDWSLPGILYRLEAYNSWGYRLYYPYVLTPYLWSFSNHYSSGKYVADGTWSDTAVSKQCGAAVILRRMAETGTVRFADDVAGEPMVRFTGDKPHVYGEALQRFLNQFPGIYVNVDSKPGRKTSDAFKKVTGHYLVGDPNGA